MSAMVRRAGRATLADGTQLLWSVADGRLGRRWRAVALRDGVQAASLLLEVDVDGRPARLELATSNGLLTLHPEATGSLHGNAVTRAGVRHIALAWSDEHDLEIEGLPIGRAVTARRLARSTGLGEGRTVPVVVVSPDLSIRAERRRYIRVDDGTWTIEADGGGEGDGEGEARRFTVDDRGIPAWDGDATEWPLELDSND
jgi:hypothetical protein